MIVDQKEHCYGCSACVNICPTRAISIVADEEGFSYPLISEGKCIDCGLCIETCPFHNEHPKSEYSQKYYAAQHNNKDVLAHSTSGGMFTALSDYVLDQNGTVYGVSFQDNLYVRHGCATDKKSRDVFCGVKYVQSDMTGIMNSVVTDLDNGKMVLFTGTPCQVAGMRSYVLKIRGNLDKLYLCDFICHGAASPKVWEDYTNFLKKKFGHIIQRYQFRSKRNGWRKSSPEFQVDNVIVKDSKRNSFFLLYRTCYINRPSCYVCQFTSYNRHSDITIGDFWNIDKKVSEPDSDLGTSEVIINTQKGEWLFRQCQDMIKYQECQKEDVWQPHLEYPEAIPKRRQLFWSTYQRQGFEAALRKFGKKNFISTCKIVLAPIAKTMGLYVVMGKVYRILFVKKTK